MPTEASSEQTQDERAVEEQSAPSEGEMPCPVCGHPMPDLKGGKDAICPVCGFKDSCCY
jgi:rubrerythrin